MPGIRSAIPNFSISLVIILALWLLANGSHIPILWGVSHYRFLPEWWFYVATTVVLFFTIPRVAKNAIRLLEQASLWAEEKWQGKMLIYSISLVLFTLLALIFPESIPLLGDGSLRANEVFDGKMWQPTEMLDFLTHALLYQKIFAPLGYSATTCYRVVSILCGLIFFFNAFMLARYIDAKRSALFFLLFSTSGMVVLFFGYIESYSLVAAYIPLLTLLLFKTCVKSSHWFWAIPAFLFGGLIHSIILPVFAAPTLYAILSNRTDDDKNHKSVNIIIAIGVLAAVTAGYFFSSIEGTAFSGYLLPLSSERVYGQALLTSRHGFNVLNWIFITALPFLFLLPVLIWNSKRFVSQNHPINGLAWWLIISALLFIILFRPQIGGPRDWDLFSLPTFCLIPAALVIFTSKCKDYTPFQMVPIVFISGLLMLSFAVINSSPRRSVERFTEIIETGKFGNLYIEYATLFNYAASYEELAERRGEFGGKAWEQPARTKQDSLYISQSLALYHLTNGDNKEAFRWIGRAMKTDSTNLSTYKILVQYYEKAGAETRLLKLAEYMESEFSTDAEGLMEAGLIYIKRGQKQKAGELFRLAYKLDQSNLVVLINLGNFFNVVEEFDSAKIILSRATALDSASFAVAIGLATAELFSGNEPSARHSLNIAEALAKSPEQFEKILYLRQLLGK